MLYIPFSALMLLVCWQKEYLSLACKNACSICPLVLLLNNWTRRTKGQQANLNPGSVGKYTLHHNIQGGPKKRTFSGLITLWRLVLERRAVCQNFRNFIEKKVQNSHFNEFKYSLPNLLKSSQQLKLCYTWPEHMDFSHFTLTHSETTVIFPQS